MTEWPDTSRSYWISLKQSWWVNFFHSSSNEKHKWSWLNLRLFHVFLNDINSLLQTKGTIAFSWCRVIPLFGILVPELQVLAVLAKLHMQHPLCTGTTLTGWGDTIHTWRTCRCPRGTLPRTATTQWPVLPWVSSAATAKGLPCRKLWLVAADVDGKAHKE